MPRLIDEQPIVNDWISVKDRMPEENVPVLVWDSQGFAFIDIHESGKWRIGTPHYAVITHWMPLPEPPKEDKEWKSRT